MDDSQLYTNARLAPVSLTYYGRCLANGNYTVTLHFAEIIFRDNRSYESLGKRAFDIYVQVIIDYCLLNFPLLHLGSILCFVYIFFFL